ncbi:hypothetical protein [Cecembia lonarensis]|uniref:Uncharacterized protein n=1 Tax=Cecembia lonarensis (strain CCUG 58316 / KCTC 22772 / LW9) TaxID=1225176 RepID=K1KTJ8_CECL9|nr:hypothetical protein [Cecembia lonarensis]EKB47515.1 hypothetical protein B879_03877 [Cecembia lonarensis LW9]
MQQDFILPSDGLVEFVTGYLLFEGDCSKPVEIQTFENSYSLGIPLGKPFDLYLGGKSLEDESTFVDIFDKPYFFISHEQLTSIWISGNIRLVFVIFTEKGWKGVMQQKKKDFNQHIFPLSRIGVPMFNLMLKRELRFNEDNVKGIEIIENELEQFFKRVKFNKEPEQIERQEVFSASKGEQG